MAPNDTVITGIGLVTALGEGHAANWQAFCDPATRPAVDTERFAPWSVHPLPEIDWSLQIEKRGDIRQMETWQRIGTYVAGLALEDAGIKGDLDLCSTMDMIVSAGGGERDVAVDQMILDGAASSNAPGVVMNEKFTTELRPTLFLAQLSNLLAGNISIVHKVTGSSRTFMGEEVCGVSAIETAVARIRSGTSTHVLVGGSYNTEHPDMLLGCNLIEGLQSGGWTPLRERGPEGHGVITGSGGAFLVLESREHAARRGRKAYACIDSVVSSNVRRDGTALEKAIAGLLAELGSADAAISGATGAPASFAGEQAATSTAGLPTAAFANLVGSIRQAQFPAAVAIAALAIDHGKLPSALEPLGDWNSGGAAERVVALMTGSVRGEGAALLSKP